MLVMLWSVHQSVSGVLEVEDLVFFKTEHMIHKYTTILLWRAVRMCCSDINSYSGVDMMFY